MDEIIERCVAQFSSNATIECNVIDANADTFALYKGNPYCLTSKHLLSVLRSPGTLYVFNLIGVENSLLGSDNVGCIARKEFTWLTPPLSPFLKNSTQSSLHIEWDPVRYCGVSKEVEPLLLKNSSIEYVLEIAEGHEYSKGIQNKFITDITYSPDYKVAYKGNSGLLDVEITDLKPKQWYHFILTIRYPGCSVTSLPFSTHTQESVPECPGMPRVTVSSRQSGDISNDNNIYNLKTSWLPPANNSSSVLKYQLQIQEKTYGKISPLLKPKGFYSDQKYGHDKEINQYSIDSPWTTVYYNLHNEAISDPPAPGAVHWKLRVRALNTIGWSNFSPILTMDSKNFPSLFPHGFNR